MNRIGIDQWPKHALLLTIVATGFAVLYAVQLQNYLLFHSIVEVFSIVVAFAVFLVTWNAREEIEYSFIVIVGISYLFVGGLDLLHTLAYDGMGVFSGSGANLPTQLWLSGRYVESISFLGAAAVGVVASERQMFDIEWTDRQIQTLLTGYAVVVALVLASIFSFDAFPRAYVAGSGLTAFKIYSEYLIIGVFASGLVLLYWQRDVFNDYVFKLLVGSILLTMGSELAFTFYVDVYGFSNVVGHFSKLASFYLIYLAVVKTGFTEPQKAIYRELAQREAEARKFEQAADHSGHAIMITDRAGTIQYVNEAWEDMTGYSGARIDGENPSILQSGEHDAAFYQELWETILAGDVWEGDVINERKDGEQFVVHQTIAPIFREEGDIQGFVAIHDEITEQVEYEEQLERDLQETVQQLQVLSRVLRHNIRNDMTVVLGNAEMVQENTSDEDIEDIAVAIEKKSRGLLTLSNKQRRIVQLLLEPTTERSFDVTEILDGVVKGIEKEYPHAEITTDRPEAVRITALSELEHAVEELVENAIIHNEQEPPRVTVRVQSTDRTVRIDIKDNGPGLPKAEKQVVTGQAEFDALLHSTGMGLWFVNQVITEMEGEIRFRDAHPRGSVVTLVVPRNQVERTDYSRGDQLTG